MLFDLYGRQLDGIERYLETWKTAYRDAREVRLVERLIASVVQQADNVFEEYQALWEKSRTTGLLYPSSKDPGKAADALFTRFSRAFQEIRTLALDFGARGYPVEGLEKLEETAVRVKELQAQHAQRWVSFPPITPEDLAEARKGESLEITDAFAEIAGLTREEWLRFVEEYKAKFPHRWRGAAS